MSHITFYVYLEDKFDHELYTRYDKLTTAFNDSYFNYKRDKVFIYDTKDYKGKATCFLELEDKLVLFITDTKVMFDIVAHLPHALKQQLLDKWIADSTFYDIRYNDASSMCVIRCNHELEYTYRFVCTCDEKNFLAQIKRQEFLLPPFLLYRAPLF
jgi:hypothetical protein